ncbi:MAG TPA: ferritin-like domain-containing protein [Chryseolinea sp.]|nr:ferritin-like domain-containing protein [Chryseolinea sp.]
MATKTASKKTSKKSSSAKPVGEGNPELLKLFVDQIKDIYWAEKHLLKALPKMQKAATTAELQDAIGTHTEQTQGHVDRLEDIFALLDQKPQAKKCDGMEGLVEEGESIIEETDKGTATRDVGIILSAQKVEHYEISSYGGLATLAKTIGRDDIAEILEETLSEEKETDELLTKIAEGKINYAAATESEEEA